MQKTLLTLSLISIMIFTITSCSEEITSAKKAYDLGNYQKAVELYSKEAHLGDSKAQYNLGVMYAKGQGTKQDYNKAVEMVSPK